MRQGKTVYDNIVIPEELDSRVREAIASVDRESAVKRAGRKKRQHHMRVAVKSVGALAAAFLICIVIGVNTSQVFAESMGNLPVVGALARVLTVRSYEKTEGDVNYSVQVPQIAMDTGNGANETAVDVNAEIEKLVDDYLQKCKTDMEEYRDAFFETGGTEEEWADRTMDVNVSYEVKYQQGSILSMVLSTEEGWFVAENQRRYYNLDLASGKELTLQDVLGENYVQTANDSIFRQIAERMEQEECTYWGFGEDAEDWEEGFTTVDENTSFYINADGKAVVCFEKYEIAPGYMGVQEFVIE